MINTYLFHSFTYLVIGEDPAHFTSSQSHIMGGWDPAHFTSRQSHQMGGWDPPHFTSNQSHTIGGYPPHFTSSEGPSIVQWNPPYFTSSLSIIFNYQHITVPFLYIPCDWGGSCTFHIKSKSHQWGGWDPPHFTSKATSIGVGILHMSHPVTALLTHKYDVYSLTKFVQMNRGGVGETLHISHPVKVTSSEGGTSHLINQLHQPTVTYFKYTFLLIPNFQK